MLIVYIHGFLSSPKSHKAKVTQSWLSTHCPDYRFVCPALSSYPELAYDTLSAILSAEQEVGLIGSSMGGFWANVFSEQLGCPSVLINPAVDPHRFCAKRVGLPLQSYYTDDIFTMSEADVAFLQARNPEVRKTDKYWLLCQQGDETLDYREAVAKFSRCRQTVLPGGNHAFEGYEEWLPDIVKFLSENNKL